MAVGGRTLGQYRTVRSRCVGRYPGSVPNIAQYRTLHSECVGDREGAMHLGLPLLHLPSHTPHLVPQTCGVQRIADSGDALQIAEISA
eukprot:3752677-Rhodomonas_salina.5